MGGLPIRLPEDDASLMAIPMPRERGISSLSQVCKVNRRPRPAVHVVSYHHGFHLEKTS